MNSKFIFKKLRCSVSKENQVVLQGYCSDGYMANEHIEAFIYSDAGCFGRLETSLIMTEAEPAEAGRLHNNDLTHIITIMIDIPKELPYKDAMMRVVKRTNDGKNSAGEEACVLYTCSVLKLIKCLDRLNYSVDSVEAEGKFILIRGWAIDREEVSLRLTQILKSKEKEVDFSIVRSERPDVMWMFAECPDNAKIGFEIRIERTKLGMRLMLNACDRSENYRVKAIRSYSRFAAVNKINRYWYKGIYTLNNYGVGDAVSKVKKRLFNTKSKKSVDYAKWIKGISPGIRELKRQQSERFKYEPYFNIVINNNGNAVNTSSYFETSIKCQTYSNWVLNNKKQPNDKEDYIVFGDYGAELTPDALYECAKIINLEKPDIIYCDEDVICTEDGVCGNPIFKPDFNIDLLRSCNYIGRVLAISKEFIQKLVDVKLGLFDVNDLTDINKLDAGNYDFILRCVENTDLISHISKVIYRKREENLSEQRVSEQKSVGCVQDVRAHLDRSGIAACVEAGEAENTCKVSYEIQGNPLISIIIPNKDHVLDLKRCMESIDNKSEYTNYEYIIVENNSVEQETFDFYDEISKRDNVKILYWQGGFNYSAINNYGEDAAAGEYLLLLNNDTEIINPDCLSQMLGYCQREDVGVVGARLYYDDGTVQHAGVVIGLGGIAGNIFVGSDENEEIYMSRTKVSCDYSAVTAACLMVKRSLYESIGGLDEEFEVAFNDIDFCLRVRQMNKLVVYNANAKLYHYESKSRGAENTLQKQDRFNDEIELFNEKWGWILRQGDPYYNPNLTLDTPDFSLRLY